MPVGGVADARLDAEVVTGGHADTLPEHPSVVSLDDEDGPVGHFAAWTCTDRASEVIAAHMRCRRPPDSGLCTGVADLRPNLSPSWHESGTKKAPVRSRGPGPSCWWAILGLNQ